MNKGFEDYIKDYYSSFPELSQYANQNGIVDRYYSSTKWNYKKFFDESDLLELNKFGVRYYRAKKEMFASAQMLIEAKRTKEVGCIIGHFFYAITLCFMQCNHFYF